MSQTMTSLSRKSRPFVLVTGNAGKIAEARLAMGTDLEAVEVDLPEIQSLDYLEVLRAKAAEAWRHVGRPLVVEEAGLDLAALNGFPGPLVKWMLQAVGAEGLSRTAVSLGTPGPPRAASFSTRMETARSWSKGGRKAPSSSPAAGPTASAGIRSSCRTARSSPSPSSPAPRRAR